MKKLWVWFTLCALLLAPLSASQALPMEITQAHASHTSNCPMHTKATEPMALGGDCCGSQALQAGMLDVCQSMDCEQSCPPCFATSVATVQGLDYALPVLLAGSFSAYQFSVQVVAPSLLTPPPNAA